MHSKNGYGGIQFLSSALKTKRVEQSTLFLFVIKFCIFYSGKFRMTFSKKFKGFFETVSNIKKWTAVCVMIWKGWAIDERSRKARGIRA